ncbi:MAG: Opr family porin [Aliarcobacter sp.]|jgi:hypothetical protein|nr:Opr family porin [Aliarcobacter sp.]
MKNLLKGNKVSLVACGLLLSSSFAFGANTIDSAFKEGKVSGSLTAYGIATDNKSNTADTDEGFGTINLGYETASYMGFSAKAGFEAGHAMADGNLENDALMTEAYIKYANDMFSITGGRQAIDLEWMGDYHEAVVAAITAIPDTTIVLGYTNQIAFADEDEISDFEQIGTDGAYVADVKYTGLEGIEFNPYAYSVPDTANWYGLKTTFTADMFGVVAHYAASNEDVAGQDDGSMGAIELNTEVAGISAAVGYIKTDKDGGIGSMAAVGDNYEPLDSGNAIYLEDAKMVYGSLGYSIVGIDLGALYGETTYNSADYKEKELNLTAGYSITESLGTSLLYANINGDEADANGTIDQQYVSLTVAYTF